MNRVLWCISKWSLFPSPNQKPQEIFLWYLLWEPGQTPEGKPHCFVEVSLRLSPPGDFNSWFCPHRTSATRQLLLRFLWWFFLKSICSVKLWLPVFPRLTLQSSGQAFVLCLTLVKGSISVSLVVINYINIWVTSIVISKYKYLDLFPQLQTCIFNCL